MDNAVVIIRAQAFGWTYIFMSLGVSVEVELLGPMLTPCLSFSKPPCCSLKWPHHFTGPAAMHEGSSFSSPLPTWVLVSPFDSGHPSECEVVFICIFLDGSG